MSFQSISNWIFYLDGPITTITRLTRTLSGGSHSKALLTQLVSWLKRSQSKQSSPTLPLESVSESNWRKTTRGLLVSSPEMVVCLSSMRTTRCSLPDSVVQAMPSVIFQESDSRLSRLPVCPSMPSGLERRKSPSSEELSALIGRLSLNRVLACLYFQFSKKIQMIMCSHFNIHIYIITIYILTTIISFLTYFLK